MVKRTLATASLALLLMGCNRVDLKGFIMPTGDVVNSRFEQSLALHSSKPVANLSTEEEYLFYVCTDPHISSTTNNLRRFVGDFRSDPEALFGIVLGDCIDSLGSMPTYVEAINHLADTRPSPIFSILGNHDLYFSQWDDFRDLVGPSHYWFEVSHSAGKDIFLALDTASGTLGVHQMGWLREFLAQHRDDYRHCIVITHANIFYNDNSQRTSGNLPLDETMELLDLFDNHDVLLCLQGHDHHRDDLSFRGVRYTIVGTLRDEYPEPEYLCVRISGNNIEFQWREF